MFNLYNVISVEAKLDYANYFSSKPKEERWTSSDSKFIQLLGDKNANYMKRVLENYKILNKGKSATKHVQEECPKSYADVVCAYSEYTTTTHPQCTDCF